MKRGYSKLFIILILLLVLSSLVLAQVSPPNVKIYEEPGKWLKQAFNYAFGNAFGGGSISELIAIKFMFFFLLFLILMAVSEYVPFLSDLGNERRWIVWLVSIIVAYLSVFYIAPEEFMAILIGYTTLGIVVSTIIPLVFLFAIIYKSSDSMNAGTLILQKLLLWGFGLVLLWRTIALSGQEGVSSVAYPLHIGTLVIVGVLIAFNKTVRNFIVGTQGYIEASRNLDRTEAMALAASLRDKALAIEATNPRGATQLRQAATRIENNLSSI